MRFARVASLVLLAGLMGCAGSPPDSFDLTSATPLLTRTSSATLRVRTPTALADLDSDRILVRAGPDKLAVLAGARWAGRLPDLVEARLTATFQNARGLRAFGEESPVAADYDIESVIRGFELDAQTKQVTVDIVVKVVSLARGRVVATREFKASAPVISTAPGLVAAALNGVLTGVMLDIATFVAASS